MRRYYGVSVDVVGGFGQSVVVSHVKHTDINGRFIYIFFRYYNTINKTSHIYTYVHIYVCYVHMAFDVSSSTYKEYLFRFYFAPVNSYKCYILCATTFNKFIGINDFYVYYLW